MKKRRKRRGSDAVRMVKRALGPHYGPRDLLTIRIASGRREQREEKIEEKWKKKMHKEVGNRD